MTDIRDQLAGILVPQLTPSLGINHAQKLAQHLADVLLSLDGIAIIELPESRPSGIIGQVEWPVQSNDADAPVTIRHDGKIASDGVSNPYRSPGAARSHAAALLAAAKAVEQSQEGPTCT